MPHISLVELSLGRQRSLWGGVSAQAAALPRPRRGGRLLLFGLGSSGHCAHLTAETARSLTGPGIRAQACSPLDIGRLVTPEASDLAVAFSHRGKSPLTLQALALCRAAGAATALVCAEDTAHGAPADTVLPTGPLERCEPHTAGMTAAVCAATSWLLGESVAAAWQRLSSSPDPDLERCREDVGEGPEVILGHGAGEWVAREAALKFVEVARARVAAFPSEEYFHGWRFAYAKARLWHVAALGDPRQDSVVSLRRFSAEDGPLGWVEALVELQWLALALAVNRRLDPDHPEPSGAANRADTV